MTVTISEYLKTYSLDRNLDLFPKSPGGSATEVDMSRVTDGLC
jgi:hypothetical protein